MTRPKVVIDTDPGVDDAVAILLALASPEIDVIGISVVAGNVPLGDALGNACRIVGLSGRSDIPVRAGAAGPLVRDQVFGKYRAIGIFGDDIVAPATMAVDTEHAVQFLVRQARLAAASGELLTICAIGPLTNVALALVQDADVARGIGHIVCMGGAFAALGHRTPWAEFNFYADPHAAEIVFRSDIPIILMSLDVTCQALFTAEHVDCMRSRGGKAGAAIAGLLTRFDRSDLARYGRAGAPLHDAMTVAWLVEPSLFQMRPAVVGVEVGGYTAGHSYADFHGQTGRAAKVMLATGVAEAGFRDLVIDRMARYGKRSAGGGG